jgi:hypothetical protein
MFEWASRALADRVALPPVRLCFVNFRGVRESRTCAYARESEAEICHTRHGSPCVAVLRDRQHLKVGATMRD